MKSLVHKKNGLIKYFHDNEKHGRALLAVWGCPKEKFGKSNFVILPGGGEHLIKFIGAEKSFVLFLFEPLIAINDEVQAQMTKQKT